MNFELNEIKDLRKKLGLTQIELAKRACVSQSLIAKIESGIIDPAFSKTKKIFDAITELSEEKSLSAKDIMNNRVISVASNEKIGSVIKKMKNHEISQLPVIDDHKAVGSVSETVILEALIKGKKELVAKDVMKDAPPILSMRASMDLVSNLLKFYSLALISEKGKLVGVITKSDIIRKLYK